MSRKQGEKEDLNIILKITFTIQFWTLIWVFGFCLLIAVLKLTNVDLNREGEFCSIKPSYQVILAYFLPIELKRSINVLTTILYN